MRVLLKKLNIQIMKKSIENLFVRQEKGWMVLNKPATLAIQADKTKDESLKELVDEKLSTSLHFHNRLDRPVSGLVLASTKKKAQLHFTKQASSGKIIKHYLAIVEKAEIPAEGHIVHYHYHNQKAFKATVKDKMFEGAKRVALDYEVIETLDRYLVLDVKIISGKFHQIRSQLSAIGTAIKGDVKYMARRSNRDRSIYLHAYELAFVPFGEKEPISITAAPPEDTLWDLAWAAKNKHIERTRS